MDEPFASPFDVPWGQNLPYTPDQDPMATFAAVGTALTHWEQMEQIFADIYSRFKVGYGHLDVMIEYARIGATFKLRMTELQNAADAFFMKQCDQHLEGSLGQLVRDARELSVKRHRIAHGTVAPRVMQWLPDGDRLQGYGADFRLVPPWYSSEKLSKPEAMYAYGSTEIHAMAAEFDELGGRVIQYRDELETLLQRLREQAP